MEFCISSKAAKFIVQVIALISIGFLVRVESHIFSEPDEQDSSSKTYSSSGSQSAPSQTQQLTFSSSRNTYDLSPAVLKPLSEIRKTDTRKLSVPKSKWISEASRQITRLLSPSTLSRADISQYLLRDVSREPDWNIEELKLELDSRLKTNQISESVMLYARALKSLIDVEVNLQRTHRCMTEIRFIRRSVPSAVSSPLALSSYGLFSKDIFDGPEAPFRLINKLMEIPKSEIPNLIVQLQNYLKIFDEGRYVEYEYRRYRRYAINLLIFLNDTLLDDLKRNLDEIQRISNLTQNSTDEGEGYNEPGLSTT